MLRQQFTDTLRGQGRLVLVGGAAGIGKTTLIEALADEAQARGALVLSGHCYDFGTTPPYGPWSEIASAYRHTGALPSFPVAFDDQRSPDVGSEEVVEGGQESLFAAIHDFIAILTRTQPLVLLLEDMHWSDPASLDLLRSLSRQIAALPLLLVVTYRSDELARRHPLYHLLPGLVRDAGARRIDLRPLTGDALRALVAARYRLPTADQERLVRYVQSHAEGNPLYIRELFRTFEEHDILQSGEAGWVLGDLRRMRVPALVRQLIDERLARLGGETRGLLAVAAVIGQEVPLDVWQRASEAPDDRLEAAVEQALEARLIEESVSGNGLRFSHALIREALYEGIILTRRRVMHRRVAEAMEHLPQPDPDAVAHHYQQAGDARAADWLVRAGERAQRTYALVIAADRFESAAALMQGDAARDRERGWLLYRAGRAVVGADGARAVACMEEAERIGMAAGDAALVAYALNDRGLVRCFMGEPRRGIAEMEAGIRALDVLPADQTPTGSEIATWIVGTAAGTEGIASQPVAPDSDWRQPPPRPTRALVWSFRPLPGGGGAGARVTGARPGGARCCMGRPGVCLCRRRQADSGAPGVASCPRCISRPRAALAGGQHRLGGARLRLPCLRCATTATSGSASRPRRSRPFVSAGAGSPRRTSRALRACRCSCSKGSGPQRGRWRKTSRPSRASRRCISNTSSAR